MPSGTVSPQSDTNASARVDDPQIELVGVRKAFGTVVAVEGADLTVGDGELFAILGPSGSGKTTVLRMIAGFEFPSAGEIYVDGVRMTEGNPAGDHLGRIRDEPVHRRPTLEQIELRLHGPCLFLGEERVEHRRQRQLLVALDEEIGEGRAELSDRHPQLLRIVGQQLVLGVALAGPPDDEVLHPEDRRLARRHVELGLPRRLDLKQTGDEGPERPRHVDEQRRLLRRRHRRAGAVLLEPRRQPRVTRRQLGAEQRIERGEPSGLIEISVAEAFDAEREVARRVARRASGAAGEREWVVVQSVRLLRYRTAGSQSARCLPASSRRRRPGRSDRAAA